MPLCYGEQVLGVLTLGHEIAHHYQPDHIALVETIGAQILRNSPVLTMPKMLFGISNVNLLLLKHNFQNTQKCMSRKLFLKTWKMATNTIL
jgi:hypothetical protein